MQDFLNKIYRKVNMKLLLKTFIILSTTVLLTTMACENYSEIESENASGGDYKTFPTVVYDGNLGGVTGADANCMADDNYPGTGTYKALIVDGLNRIASVSANAGDGQVDWVLKANSNYYLTDGATKIMTTDENSLFTFGSLDNSFNGVGFAGSPSWTGLNQDWTANANNCNFWNSALETDSANFGFTSSSSATAISDATAAIPCSNTDTSKSPLTVNFYTVLICVEQ